MSNSVLVLLLIILVVDAVQERKELLYIGSFKSEDQHDLHHYYVSQDEVEWPVAYQDCLRFAPKGALVSIESMEEWEFLSKAMGNVEFDFYDTSSLWTSGMYSVATSEWIWATNNQSIALSSPWETGNPPKDPKFSDRIYILHKNNDYTNWQTFPYAFMIRYICEVQ